MALTLAPVNSAFAYEDHYSSPQIVENSEDGTATFQAIIDVKPEDVAGLKTGTVAVRLLGDDVELTDVVASLDVACVGAGVVAFNAADFDGKTQASLDRKSVV